MKTKTIFFYLILIFILILSMEFISFGLLKYVQSKDIIFKDTFQLRDYSERTNDKRLITLKKNFSKQNIDSLVNDQKENWSIFTSKFRTRVSESDFRSNKEVDIINTETPKILFIGDSVPFGYSLNNESSLPFLFGQKKLDYLSINASIPSYSLGQSVARYIIEFSKINNLKYVYLQIYDPVSQYAILGSNWKETDNWTNRSDQVLRQYGIISRILDIEIPFYGKTYFFIVLQKILIKYSYNQILFKLPDQNSDKRFILHIKKELDDLSTHLKLIDSKLIIAPITLNHNKWDLDDENLFYHLRAIKILNKTLREYATHQNVIFIDTISILEKDFNKNFIDGCCHISKAGANLIASHLIKIVNNP